MKLMLMVIALGLMAVHPMAIAAEPGGPQNDSEYEFDGPVFDIAALPNGGILVADFDTVREIRGNEVREITTLPVVEGAGDRFGTPAITLINGLAPIGQGNFFATRSGLDLAVGAALLRATRGNARVVADIEDFILGDWPEGPGQVAYWKNVDCEPPGGFSAGPHTNPYHLTALSGSEVLIADAAGNFLLYAKTDGSIEVVATFDPVTDPGTGDRLIQFPLSSTINCPVEPVPTSVDVGPDGAYYVGQLTGTTAENLADRASPDGLASVWRIEPGARDVICPSSDCTKAVTGLDSVIDIEFGPDGQLYVVEFDSKGFFPAVVLNDLGLGTVKRCDVVDDSCELVEEGLVLPGAITFDKWDNLWLVENVFAPTVRQVDWK